MLGLFGTSSDIEVSSQRVNSRLPFASLAFRYEAMAWSQRSAKWSRKWRLSGTDWS